MEIIVSIVVFILCIVSCIVSYSLGYMRGKRGCKEYYHEKAVNEIMYGKDYKNRQL